MIDLLILAIMGDHIRQNEGHPADDRQWTAVWQMTGFIHQQYDNKITLDEISKAGSVCRSRCCDLFRKYLGQTRNAYLTRCLHRTCAHARRLPSPHKADLFAPWSPVW